MQPKTAKCVLPTGKWWGEGTQQRGRQSDLVLPSDDCLLKHTFLSLT